MIAAASFGLICYLVGNTVFANSLQINNVAGAGELAVLCGALVGAGPGFLWFNAPPATVFIADTGSLAPGRAPCSIHEIVTPTLVLGPIGRTHARGWCREMGVPTGE